MTASDFRDVRARWAIAVESYRRSVDLYRQVWQMRKRRAMAQSFEMTPWESVFVPPRPDPVPSVDGALPCLHALTARERDVAGLIARGYTNQQIADTLVVTRGTVANHVAHILSKLSLSNRTQVAARVSRDRTHQAGHPSGDGRTAVHDDLV